MADKKPPKKAMSSVPAKKKVAPAKKNPWVSESAQSKAQKKALKKGSANIKGFTFGRDTI